MSVLIKMAMPKNCYECRFCETYTGHHLCVAFLNYIADPRSGRLETCPLVELPDHGRLVDADALIKKWRESLGITEEDRGAVFVGYTQIPSFVNSMPTVIPAERSEDG